MRALRPLFVVAYIVFFGTYLTAQNIINLDLNARGEAELTGQSEMEFLAWLARAAHEGMEKSYFIVRYAGETQLVTYEIQKMSYLERKTIQNIIQKNPKSTHLILSTFTEQLKIAINNEIGIRIETTFSIIDQTV